MSSRVRGLACARLALAPALQAGLASHRQPSIPAQSLAPICMRVPCWRTDSCRQANRTGRPDASGRQASLCGPAGRPSGAPTVARAEPPVSIIGRLALTSHLARAPSRMRPIRRAIRMRYWHSRAEGHRWAAPAVGLEGGRRRPRPCERGPPTARQTAANQSAGLPLVWLRPARTGAHGQWAN